MTFVQQDRLLRISGAPFTSDNVLLTGLSGHEAMSRLYSFQLEFVCTKLDLKAPDLVGKPIKVEIAHTGEDENKPPRFINGYINRLSAGDVSGEDDAKTKNRSYRAELVPWLWFLTQTARCFIYFPEKEDKTIFEIIKAVFDRAKEELHIDPVVDLTGINELKNRKVKHCVQYRETDFNFVSRILEKYGAYYYFTQKDGEHTMVVDMTTNYPTNEQAQIPFPSGTVAGKTKGDHINSWEHAYEFVSGKWTHSDYNFETPSAKLRSNSPKVTASQKDAEKYEVYDYPGEYRDAGEGKTDARIRQEEEEVPHDTVQATSSCRTMMPGHTFTLRSHPDGSAVSEKGSYLISSIQHHASQPGPETSAGTTSDYTNSFNCVPDKIQFRPARITPKPVVSGIQTAVVVGPKGEEIHTDEYGRIKVAFHWDREDEDREKKDRKKVENGEKFFCWVRVAQNIAGNKWGFMAIPRIGQEVVIDFLEGDPDQPLVVGSVYNDEQMPHYDLDEHKTKTYIKTNSSPGGDGHNELRFEDKKDNEQIYMHAERNMDVRVKNDSKEIIYGNRHQVIGWEKDGEKGGDQKEEIKKDRHIKVHANHTEHIGGDMQLMVGGIDGDGNQDIVVKMDKKEHVEGDSHEHVNQAKLVAIDGNRNTNIGGDNVLDVTGSSAHIAGADHWISGVNILVEGTAICLKSGGNSITIDPSGVTIVGTLVRINSGPAAPVISQAAMLQSAGPEDAQEAEPAEPAKADNSKTGAKSAPT